MLDKLKKMWSEGVTIEVKPQETAEKVAVTTKKAVNHYIKTEQVKADATAIGDKSKAAIDDIKAKLEAKKAERAEKKALAAANVAITEADED